VKTDYDSPWKDMLETYFQSALELCFPHIARQINWAKGVQLLSNAPNTPSAPFSTCSALWIGL
jgi:hypothetical protein